MNNGKPGELKPLIKVAGKEILSHIISIYSIQGITKFILLGGYRINDLKDFANFFNNTTINIKVLDTGTSTPTGGRLLQAKDLITGENFLLTYGDSVTNFNLKKCNDLIIEKNANMAISTYKKILEYGVLDINSDNLLDKIHEKTFSVPINAGFYILNNKVFDYINSNEDSFEIDVLPRIISDKENRIAVNELNFWHPMDTPNDRVKLNEILVSRPNIFFE